MSKRALVSILLLPSIVVVLALVTRSDQVLTFLLGPVDDPQYFCSTVSPSPVVDMPSSGILRECSAGKTVTIGHGQTIAIVLQGGIGVDSSTRWHDFNVSDESVLKTVIAPTNGGGYPGRDEVAVYQAVKTGRSSLSAIQTVCGWNACGRDHLWKVTIEVT
jgi:hypothetical protein